MGVRFACHACGLRLNIKSELAGRRGKCPSCGVRFRIPEQDAEQSIPLNHQQDSQTGPAESTSDGSAAELLPADRSPGDEDSGDQLSGATEAPRPTTDPTPTPEPSAATEAPRPTIAETPTLEPSGALPESAAPVRRFAIIDEDPGALWYIRPRSGGQYGPASNELLYEWIEQGRVSSTALLWRDGWAQWRGVAEALPELNQTAPTAPGPSISISTEDAPLLSTEPAASKAAGEPAPGAVRSQRKGRRMLIFGLLVALSVLLVVALIFVIANSS